jgi:hypothetical protein
VTPSRATRFAVASAASAEEALRFTEALARSCAAAPAELIGEVPAEWVLAVGDAQLGAWEAIGDDPKHAELTVLTACRVWRFAEGAATAPRLQPGTGRCGVIPRSW